MERSPGKRRSHLPSREGLFCVSGDKPGPSVDLNKMIQQMIQLGEKGSSHPSLSLKPLAGCFRRCLKKQESFARIQAAMIQGENAAL